jgi:anti-sigma factor RsiW/TolA-binding protein
MSANCETCQDQLLDAIEGQLSPQELAQFEASLTTCPDCKASYESLKESFAFVRQHWRTHEPPARLDQAIVEQATTYLPSQASKGQSPTFWDKWSTLFAGLFARPMVGLGMAALVIGAFVYKTGLDVTHKQANTAKQPHARNARALQDTQPELKKRKTPPTAPSRSVANKPPSIAQPPAPVAPSPRKAPAVERFKPKPRKRRTRLRRQRKRTRRYRRSRKRRPRQKSKPRGMSRGYRYTNPTPPSAPVRRPRATSPAQKLPTKSTAASKRPIAPAKRVEIGSRSAKAPMKTLRGRQGRNADIILRQNQSSTDTFWLRGLQALQQGRTSQANAIFQNYILRFPTNQRQKAYLRVERLYRQKQQTRALRKLVNRLMTVDKSNRAFYQGRR